MSVTEIQVTASGGGEIPCISAFPSQGVGTGVVVVPSIFGVDADMAMVADRLPGKATLRLYLIHFGVTKISVSLVTTKRDEKRAFARLRAHSFRPGLR